MRVPSTDVLRLELADDPSGLANLVANPNGELGGWGWVTPLAGTAMSGDADGGGLTYSSAAVGLQWFQTEDMTVPALYYVAASWRLVTSTLPPATGLWVHTDWQWVNASGTVISTTPAGPWIDTSLSANRGHTQLYGPNQAPAGAVKVRLRFTFARADDGSATNSQPFSMTLDQVTVATAATAAELGSMRQNLIPDPSFEASPITDAWQAAGPNVSLARDTSQHWDGAASARVQSTATTVRTNWVRNPSAITDLTDWMTVDGHQTLSRDDSGQAAEDAACFQLVGDGTRAWMAASGNPHNTIPVVPGDRLATRARFRLGNPGISTWHDGARAAVIMRWVDAAGNYIGGTFGWSSHASKTITAAQAGIWFELSSQTTIPATVSGVVPAGVRMGWHFSDSTYNIPANRRAYFDKFLVEKTANPAGAYFDGSFADTATVSYDWVTASGPTDSARTSTETTKLTTTSTPGLATAAQFPVRAGRDYTVSAATMMLPAPDADTGPLVTAELRWYDASHNPLTPATTAATFPSRVTGAWQRQGVTVTTPASAAFATLAIYPASLGPVDAFYVDAVMVEAGTTMGSFIVGQVTTGGLPYIPPVSWVDILGAAHDITVSRQSLNVGTMAASVLDANLDPSRDDLLHPGRRVRLMALSYGGDWQPVFTGTISQAEVTYDPQIPAPRRARITLSAVDALATLANIARDEGVGRIADLPYVLEGCGVPWDVNGSGNQVPTAVVVARNDSTSALDQVALTRDSAQGIAWLDRYGTLHAYDDTGGYVGVVTMLDEGVYSDIDISFNTSAVINEVNLNVQRYNPGTGDTEEVPYGPYVDADSVAEWGAFSAEFRVQGVTETTSNLAAWAQAVLDANGTPVRRINAMTLPITEPEHVDVTRALLDLENLTGTQNLAADLMDNLRIQSIEHRITTTTWVMSIGFGVDGQVAQPTFTPAPGNTSGLTLNELLRPVGEVTMFYGAKSDIPAGWLPLDGSPFSSTTYPKLFDLLGTATLPNMADQFPIGAGTKALGTTGGSPTKTLTAAQMAHTHGISSQSDHQHGISGQDADTSPLSGGSGSGSAVRNSQYGGHAHGTATGNAGQHSHGGATAGVTLGSPTAVDVMNPWRSLWFIIRAL